MKVFVIWLAIVFACVCSAQAQEHTAKIIEVLPDDQFIVEISGREYRAISGAKVVELAKQKIELDMLKANEVRYQDRIKIAEQDTTIANQKAQIHETNFRHAMQMYTTERELRQEASQFLPHGKVGGFGGKVLDAMDSFWFQAAMKFVPIYTAWRTTKRD